MVDKPERRAGHREVAYSRTRWGLLRQYRENAARIVTALERAHLQAFAHGSVARGDVDAKSDVDVFVPEMQSSFLIEAALEKARVPISARLLVQATPAYAVKAHIEVDANTSVSFPLLRMRRVEREFYRFGGEVSLAQLKADVRVAGVDKRLILIEPAERGHVESSVIGREAQVARILGVSAETVLDRVRVLLKRDQVGRTGVFIKRELAADETFELALKKLTEGNPAVRRRVKKAGL